jgi:DNA-binding XRE family transcriptional regulator
MGGISTMPLYPGREIEAYLERAGATREELADELGVSRQTLYRWIKNGAPVHIELAIEALGRRLEDVGR